MKQIKIVNRVQRRVLIPHALMTEDFVDRLTGLMFKKPSWEFSALVIDRCSGVHTFFMRFDLDLVFLDKNGKVLLIAKKIKPFRISYGPAGSYYVIELPTSKAISGDFLPGDDIDFEQLQL